MSDREVISPEECPEPFWHETHRYCPGCSWREEPTPPPPTPLSQALVLLDRWQDGWSDSSDFPLLHETRAFIQRHAPAERETPAP